jgi:hypothetical protein
VTKYATGRKNPSPRAKQICTTATCCAGRAGAFHAIYTFEHVTGAGLLAVKGIRIIFQVVNGDEAVSVQSSRIVPMDQLSDVDAFEATAGRYARRFWDSFDALRPSFGDVETALSPRPGA